MHAVPRLMHEFAWLLRWQLLPLPLLLSPRHLQQTARRLPLHPTTPVVLLLNNRRKMRTLLLLPPPPLLQQQRFELLSLSH
jgi:hypothetical protein